MEEDATLADDIRAERLARCIDIQRLASILSNRIPNEGVNTPVQGLPQDGPPQPAQPLDNPPVGVLPVVSLPPPKTMVVGERTAEAIGNIPTLQTGDTEPKDE